MALFLVLVGFQCLLFYYNVPPKAALYRIIGRFFDPPQSLRPVLPDAPYRLIKPSADNLHKPILLNLETSDGSGQAVHPDVVYIPGGFGKKKWPYWMVCTPYPNGDEHFENPELFVSYDGISWSIPDGVRNPLVPPPQEVGRHHSDPDILFHDNMLWIVYRLTIRKRTGRENILYLIKSRNGDSWTIPTEILRDDKGAELLSPAVIHDGERFILWTIEIRAGEFHVVRRTSKDCLAWDAPALGNTPRFENGRHPWHIDVIEDKGRLSAVVVSCTGRSGQGSRLHYAYSVDQGLDWQVSDFLLEQLYEFESSLQYRGTLRRLDDVGGYQLWYSAVSNKGVSSIAYLPVTRVQNALFPRANATNPAEEEHTSV